MWPIFHLGLCGPTVASVVVEGGDKIPGKKSCSKPGHCLPAAAEA